MRVTLSCVLLFPAALHLLLCHAPSASAATAAATSRPLPLPPPIPARYTRHDPLLGLGLLAGFSRHLSLTPQETPLSSQPLDALTLALMQRPSPDPFLGDALPRTEIPASHDLRDVSNFPLNDFDVLQGILDSPADNSGRHLAGTGVREKGFELLPGLCGVRGCLVPLYTLADAQWPPIPPKGPTRPPLPESPWPALSSPWLKAPPTKRYLGIELPDYIATSYSSIKTDNAHYLTKLHQLKQRMRSAGK